MLAYQHIFLFFAIYHALKNVENTVDTRPKDMIQGQDRLGLQNGYQYCVYCNKLQTKVDQENDEGATKLPSQSKRPLENQEKNNEKNAKYNFTLKKIDNRTTMLKDEESTDKKQNDTQKKQEEGKDQDTNLTNKVEDAEKRLKEKAKYTQPMLNNNYTTEISTMKNRMIENSVEELERQKIIMENTQELKKHFISESKTNDNNQIAKGTDEDELEEDEVSYGKEGYIALKPFKYLLSLIQAGITKVKTYFLGNEKIEEVEDIEENTPEIISNANSEIVQDSESKDISMLQKNIATQTTECANPKIDSIPVLCIKRTAGKNNNMIDTSAKEHHWAVREVNTKDEKKSGENKSVKTEADTKNKKDHTDIDKRTEINNKSSNPKNKVKTEKVTEISADSWSAKNIAIVCVLCVSGCCIIGFCFWFFGRK